MKKLWLIVMFVAIIVITSNAALAGNQNKDKKERGENEDREVSICHVPTENTGEIYVFKMRKSAWDSGQNDHTTHDLDFEVDKDHPCPPPVEPPQNIPEFSTIAFPIAGVLGLMLLMKRRNK